MLLQGDLHEFSLPEVLQLIRASAGSGSLVIRHHDEIGTIQFGCGAILFAGLQPEPLPLERRVIEAALCDEAQLQAALVLRGPSGGGLRLARLLIDQEGVDAAGVERIISEQIEDNVFAMLGWAHGTFEFNGDEELSPDEAPVRTSVTALLADGRRRGRDEKIVLQQLGSPSHVPRLSCCNCLDERGHVVLTVEEWRIIVHIDGSTDIAGVLRGSGLDRLEGARILHGLAARGLVTTGEASVESNGEPVNVVVRGPIDIYNELFLSTLTDCITVRQLTGERELEIPVIAGQWRSAGDADGEGGEAAQALLLTAPSNAPDDVWRRIADEAAVWVLLANANDADSLRATRHDLQFVRSLGDVPYLIATYVSMADDELSREEIAGALGLDAAAPLRECQLRERDSVASTVRAALDLAAARRS